MVREPLTRDEVIQAIERKGGRRVPLVFHKWWGNGLEEKYGTALNDMAENYPDDIFSVFFNCPGTTVSTNSNPDYRWGFKENYIGAEKHSIGEKIILLPDWSELDRFFDNFPDPSESGTFDEIEKQLPQAGDRYKLGCWWELFHERFWEIRGMENLMIDYYEHMDELKLLGSRLLAFYKGTVDRYKAYGFDGIFTSDDLGHQTGPMMSPAIFKELYLPLYKEFIGYVHGKGMHVFLHSCGDNTKLMGFLIEAGLDVFHPVQKGCMDEVETAHKYGDKISFLAGVDVQHLLPEGTVQGVQDGIEKFIDAFYKPSGGLLLAQGNGIMPDTPLENIEAALKTMSLYRY
jgi:uroporphyrinogen decarboxylase